MKHVRALGSLVAVLTLPFGVGVASGGNSDQPSIENETVFTVSVLPRTQAINPGGTLAFQTHITGIFDTGGLFSVIISGLPCLTNGQVSISSPPGTIDYTLNSPIQTSPNCPPGTYIVRFDLQILGSPTLIPGDEVTVVLNGPPPPPPPPPGCNADANGDHQVNAADLSELLAVFGTRVDPWSSADFNGDAFVDGADVSVCLAEFGNVCP